ncbi:MAG: ATP-binding protein [Novosphingobium aromaticivorans]|nr:ATP-binding protein [Novosphingobium aromaticivorans]
MSSPREHHGWRAYAAARPLGQTARWLLPLITVLLAGAIFAADTLTDYEIAAATFYVVVVLLASRFCGMRALLAVAGACLGLTILSYFLTHDGNFHTGIINTAISLLAIGAVAWLAVRSDQAQGRADIAQAQLARVTRITTLGGIGAAIAHEVNQPLAAIVANAGACRRWMGGDPPRLDRVAATIDDIEQDATRASAIIARVRNLISNAAPRRQRSDINDTIRQAMALIAPQMRERGIDLHLAAGADLPALSIDPVQIQQVVLNLLVNASEAIDHASGEIGIVTKGARGGVMISVEDNGSGLGAGTLLTMFEPFHSTKQGGIGMGLAICRSIVEAHGGTITAAARAPNGLMMTIFLPVSGIQP